MVGKGEQYELETLLHRVREQGYIRVPKYTVWRLLGKGSNASGTWRALLDVWEGLGDGYKRSSLHLTEMLPYHFVITESPSAPMTKLAGESN
jgi:hypothetical protein